MSGGDWQSGKLIADFDLRGIHLLIARFLILSNIEPLSFAPWQLTHWWRSGPPPHWELRPPLSRRQAQPRPPHARKQSGGDKKLKYPGSLFPVSLHPRDVFRSGLQCYHGVITGDAIKCRVLGLRSYEGWGWEPEPRLGSQALPQRENRAGKRIKHREYLLFVHR